MKYDLNLHIASVHEGKKPFKCEICDDQFELKHELNEHIASVHEEENQSAHNDFEQFLKSCTSEVCVLRGRVPRGLTVPMMFTKALERSANMMMTNIACGS